MPFTAEDYTAKYIETLERIYGVRYRTPSKKKERK